MKLFNILIRKYNCQRFAIQFIATEIYYLVFAHISSILETFKYSDKFV